MEETLEEFRERTKDLTDGELKEEFLNKYMELCKKYKCTHVLDGSVKVIKID